MKRVIKRNHTCIPIIIAAIPLATIILLPFGCDMLDICIVACWLLLIVYWSSGRISVGEKWIKKDKGNPFIDDPVIVKIIDIKDGWVKYRLPDNSFTYTSCKAFKQRYEYHSG